MISLGLCDTDVWGNGSWKFSFAIIKCIKKTIILYCNNIPQYYCFYYIPDQTYIASVSPNFTNPKLLNTDACMLHCIQEVFALTYHAV